MKLSLKKYIATISYLTMIVFINVGFAKFPTYYIWGYEVSAMNLVAGIVYLARDFAQRELNHYVFACMLLGTLLSYWLATPAIATASVTAFAVGEFIDWGIYSYSKKSLSQRLIISASLSAPIDSILFLSMIQHANIISILIMTFSKVIGIAMVWGLWKYQSLSRHSHATP